MASAARQRRRLYALLTMMCVAAAAAVARLAVIQGASAARYAALGESERLHSVVLPPERGAIYDRNGAELAMSVPQKTVWANPHLVRDPEAEAKALSPVLNLDEQTLQARLSAAGSFVYLARKVDGDTAGRVAALHLDGVSFIEEAKRFDPAGSLALPLLGAVGLDNEGLSGLEVQFDKRLAGRPGELVVERDPHGTEITSGVRQYRPSLAGDGLVLTVDRSMQYETERALSAEIVASNAKGGMAIVMNPQTGEILAMASLVAGVNGAPPGPAPSNLSITSVYEPGSVSKVVTIAGALEDGVIHPTDSLTVPDHMMVANALFQDHTPHPTKPWSITDIVANSSNIGTIMIGEKLGKARIDAYDRAFGFGRFTGLGFPGESPGLLLDPSAWSGTSIGTIPIGQGIAVTSLQMLGALNTIANGGEYVAPRVVSATIDQRGRTYPTLPSARRRVVSTTTARELTGMLDEVVRVGTGTAAHVDGYTVAGKTGTARKPLDGARGYQAGAYVSTFAGFVPAEAPRLSAIVVLDQPTPIYGGLVCAPVFADLARYGLRLFRIPPPLASAGPAVPAASMDALAAADDAGIPPATAPPSSAPAPPGNGSSPATVPAAAQVSPLPAGPSKAPAPSPSGPGASTPPTSAPGPRGAPSTTTTTIAPTSKP